MVGIYDTGVLIIFVFCSHTGATDQMRLTAAGDVYFEGVVDCNGVNTSQPSYFGDIQCDELGADDFTIAKDGGTVKWPTGFGLNTPNNTAGDRIILWPGYKLGMNSRTMWYNVPSEAAHKFYVNSALRMTVGNSSTAVVGQITATSNITAYFR